MRILQVLHLFRPRLSAGAEVYTDSLSRCLKLRGHDVHLMFTDKILSEPNYARVSREHGGLPCQVVVNNLLYESFEETFSNEHVDRAFCEVLDEVQPDLVHFQHLMLLSLGLPAIARSRGIRTLMTLHDFWLYCARFGRLQEHGGKACDGPEPNRCAACLLDFEFAQTLHHRELVSAISIREELVADLLTQIDLFLSPSKSVRDWMVSFGLPEDRIQVVPLGIQEIQGLQAGDRRPLDGRAPVLGYIGTLAPHTGVHVLVEAMRHLEGEGSLIIYGHHDDDPSYVNSLKSEAQQLPIRFAGAIPRSEIGAAFDSIDVLVLPSVWLESFPMVIQEAHLAGVTVVASNLGGMAVVIEDGVDGLLFDLNDPVDLAHKLDLLLAEPERIYQMAEQAELPFAVEEHAARVEQALLGIQRATPEWGPA